MTTPPTMTQTEFHRFCIDVMDDAFRTMTSKAKDYAQEQDAFLNFHTRAEQLGLTREQVWAVFANKHWDALMAYVREGKVESEALRSRVTDVINYALFLAGFEKAVQDEAERAGDFPPPADYASPEHEKFGDLFKAHPDQQLQHPLTQDIPLTQGYSCGCGQ